MLIDHMKTKQPTEGPEALDNFNRTMKTLFRVKKTEVQEPKRTPQKKTGKPRS